MLRVLNHRPLTPLCLCPTTAADSLRLQTAIERRPAFRLPKIREASGIQSACIAFSISVSRMLRLTHNINSMSSIPRIARVPLSEKQPNACPHCGSHNLTRRGTRKK